MSELLDRARSGDRDALGTLWSTHQHLVLRFLRGMGCASPEDVASTVWIDVARSLARFAGGETDFRRWLFTIARRRAIDDVRRSARRPEVLDPAAGDGLLSADTADEFERSDALGRAIALVRTLPGEQAEVVLLRVIADLDVAEIAAIVGRTEVNVRVMVHRALGRLSERLAVTDEPATAMRRVP